MTFRLVDQPPDRPEFVSETIAILSRDLDDERDRLLEQVAAASDAELTAGTDVEWGVGMIAYHLLVTERGMVGIAMRLARGQQPSTTAQPRPDPGSTTRAALVEAAGKAAQAVQQLRAEFPSAPAFEARAPSPYFGPFNCIAWLFAARFHYQGHREALEQGRASAL